MGHIISLDRLSTQNTQHGHSEVFASCEDGTFSVQTNVYPRSSWADQALTKHALLKTGAAGPYAVDSRDPDMVFRSRHGIQTLRSAAATASRMGGQFAPLSNPVATFMQADHEPFLRFTSLIDWTRGGRLFCPWTPMCAGATGGTAGSSFSTGRRPVTRHRNPTACKAGKDCGRCLRLSATPSSS